MSHAIPVEHVDEAEPRAGSDLPPAASGRTANALDSTTDTVAEYSKKERAELRRLASEAYERELGSHLAELDKSFSEWRDRKLSSSELSERIHQFHQHTARDIWSTYQAPHDSMLVARAIAMRILSEEEVPATLREKLSDVVASFAERSERAV
jgi:hypothetical protein